jgi:hypothetical protein
MELPKNFSPTDVCAGLGLRSCGFRKLGDGPWAGTIWVGDKTIEVEELATKWRVQNWTGEVFSGTTLEQALRRAMAAAGLKVSR